MIIMLLSICII